MSDTFISHGTPELLTLLTDNLLLSDRKLCMVNPFPSSFVAYLLSSAGNDVVACHYQLDLRFFLRLALYRQDVVLLWSAGERRSPCVTIDMQLWSGRTLLLHHILDLGVEGIFLIYKYSS